MCTATKVISGIMQPVTAQKLMVKILSIDYILKLDKVQLKNDNCHSVLTFILFLIFTCYQQYNLHDVFFDLMRERMLPFDESF